MALDSTSHDIYRATTDLVLPTEVSSEVFAKTIENSAVMQLGQRIDLPGRGLSIPVITGDATAQIVNEAAEKPVGSPAFTTKTMTPKKFAIILPFSNEFRRDWNALYNELTRRLPLAIAKAFDNQVFNVAGITGFDSLNSAQSITNTGDIDADLINGIDAIAGDGYSFNGLAVSPLAEAHLMTAVTGIGTPLFVQNFTDQVGVGRVFGAPVAKSSAVAYAVGGDWSHAKWGMVNDIEIAVSEEATINDGTKQINLWQRNMFAVRCEAELGFVVADADAFFKIPASA